MMTQQIEESIGKILKTQNCKKSIENKLTNKKLKPVKDTDNNLMEINCMLFQIANQGLLTDHTYLFPCIFDLKNQSKVPQDQQNQKQQPKTGSYIRAIKMDFDLKNCYLIIYDYQYLGGAQSITPSNPAKVSWNHETINQIIRKNNTVKGGEILIDAYINDQGPKQPFQYPKVQFLTVKGMEKILASKQKPSIDLNLQKIRIPKEQVNQSKNSQKIQSKIRSDDI